MARGASIGRPIAGAVAEIAQYLAVFPFERQGMPRFFADHRHSAQRLEGATLRRGVADGAGADQCFARSRPVKTIVTPETAGPVAVPDVVRIG